ncbi:Vitamin B12 import ATP-binding protein BtuD [Paenibacillus sp. JJ-100]|uniref:ABC transporter ATP-binding protein n=1 Tax=Paenibacillus sp. JJ-100 TaxID=2974896 RepID=UPI0022FF6E5C|nr:ABC transporter ATP-binding protein [Paenibacillus sp. JJ-100]CAI6081479.1 Vitamin B12 import ATP-binding protein BtuD [Paenibacillus sp. JJ-100]
MTIVTQDLYKKYGNQDALKGINITIPTGMYGILGRNGAGKTTFMRILTTLIEPNSGSVEMNGIPLLPKNVNKIKAMVGYLPQEFGFYPNFTVRESLEYIGLLNKMDSRIIKARIDDILEEVNLIQHTRKKVRQLSGGMKRRLGVAQAILHEPEILIVDEPTTGVDPEERIALRNLLSNYSRDKIVILSTHIIEDIASTCNQIAILDQGRLAFDGEVRSLIKQGEGCVWTAMVYDVEELDLVKESYPVLSTRFLENGIEIRMISRTRPAMECSPVSPSIEDAYMLLLKG